MRAEPPFAALGKNGLARIVIRARRTSFKRKTTRMDKAKSTGRDYDSSNSRTGSYKHYLSDQVKKNDINCERQNNLSRNLTKKMSIFSDEGAKTGEAAASKLSTVSNDLL